MSIRTVIRYRVRPDKSQEWENALAAIAARADGQNDPLHWTTLQVVGQDLGAFEIVVPAQSMADAAGLEPAGELVARLFRAADAERILASARAAVETTSLSIVRDRPDLSYPTERMAQDMTAAFVTRMIVRPGHREACEELLRKIAEAIPKTDDIRRFTTYQPLIGDLRELSAVRPVRELAELDQAMPIEELLNQGFGAAEGGLVFRQGVEGIEMLRAELLRVRPDLSRGGATESAAQTA